ncbi:MAG TPA: signal recognition particle-docking protein FtsY [Alphaproteobacteria bacterium]
MSWFQRLKDGLSRSSNRLVDGINQVLGGRKLDDAALDELEEALIAADLGPAVAQRVVNGLRGRRFENGDPAAVRGVFAEEIAKILAPVAKTFDPDETRKPHVVLVVGVNGTGKTTTIGKFAYGYRNAGWRVMIAACDTFRAAAVSQLQIWGERAGVPVVTGPERADPAALAYQALERARAENIDLLFIDTAGRLHNKADLMAELQKIIRVLRKLDPSAPHSVLLTLDATTGQNALAQVETFKSMVEVNGLVVTKLDGSARGGVLVAIAEKFAIPVVAVGVGEGVEDLAPFTPDDFAKGLLGLS